MANWRIERLGRAHERRGFACGKESLDDFLKQLVGQYEKRDLGRTYVAVRPGESRVLGYYTLAAGSIMFEHFPAEAVRKLPRHSVPATLIGRLAVDRSSQGQGLGGILLAAALRRCMGLADAIGLHVVEVQAIDEEARGFYGRYNFLPLADGERRLYLPVATIREMFELVGGGGVDGGGALR